jgi:choline dehydrogenase-like flavoprotein
MERFDVVVIGSGAGGAPVAATLARAGAKVLVVEKGKSYTRDDFDRDEIEWCRRDRFVPSPSEDPHTRRNDEGMNARPTTDGWISTVVGGGTVHMGAYLMRADPMDAFQATRLGKDSGSSALDWAVPFVDVAAHYAAAERALGVSGGPEKDALPPLASHTLSQKVDDAARALGLPVQATPRGIITEARPDDDRKACAYRQLCASYGCPNDAKSSMIATYLRSATKAGVTLWTESMATKIVRGPDGLASGVVVRRRGKPEETVAAGKVVVACGAIESARLLLLSGEGFNPGGNVGKHLWFSLFVEATGFLDHKKHAAAVPDLMHGSPFLNRTVNMGGHLDAARAAAAGVDRAGTLQVGFVHDNPIHRAERVATEGGLIFGKKLKGALARQFKEGRQVVVECFGESIPHTGAYIDLDPRAKDRHGLAAARITHFHHPRDGKVAGVLGKDALALLEKMGAVDVRLTRKMSETMVLQGGTCRFGVDPSTSVTDATGRLHTCKNVYVTDGGALPSSTAVPTTLTIVANALRVAALMSKA